MIIRYPCFLATTISNRAEIHSLLAFVVSLLAFVVGTFALLFSFLTPFCGDLHAVPRNERRYNCRNDSDSEYHCQSAKASGGLRLFFDMATLGLQLSLVLRFAFLCSTLALRSLLFTQLDARPPIHW